MKKQSILSLLLIVIICFSACTKPNNTNPSGLSFNSTDTVDLVMEVPNYTFSNNNLFGHEDFDVTITVGTATEAKQFRGYSSAFPQPTDRTKSLIETTIDYDPGTTYVRIRVYDRHNQETYRKTYYSDAFLQSTIRFY